jgi:hypothetical protein
VSKPYLDGLPALTDAETVRFFDGAIPSWRHAQSPRIPRLSHAEKLRDRITGALADATASAMQLIRAAGGEGKSTAMLQAAVDVVRTSDILALYHVSKDARLHPNQIETLDPDAQWLIVADDADELIEDLWACAERLHALGRTNKGWATRLTRLDDLEIGGIEASDAGRIVQAWERYGDAGLRLLGNVPTSEERAERLVKAARAQDVRGGDGSFFGGLLETRFSPEGLVDHVVELMRPLREADVAGGSGRLYDALSSLRVVMRSACRGWTGAFSRRCAI